MRTYLERVEIRAKLVNDRINDVLRNIGAGHDGQNQLAIWGLRAARVTFLLDPNTQVIPDPCSCKGQRT